MTPPRPLARFAAFARRRAIALWLVLMLAAAAITVRTHYVADLSAFLPSTPSAEQAVLLDQLRGGIAARLLLIGIEGGSAEQRSAASLGFANALRKSGAFDAVHNGDNSSFEATGKFLFEHRYLLSPAVDAQRFTVDGLRAGIDEATSLLGTPAGAAVKAVILRDPTGETIRMAEGMLPSQAPRSDGRVWISRSAERAVLIATTHADGADLDAQERTLQLVRTSFAPFEAQGLKLVLSGSGTFAVASRTQIKAEVERLAIAGGVAIVGLMLLAFGGSLRTLATALLPVGSGVLAGIAAVSLIFGNVHGITLGFGTTLIGEAVDYAIYYLIQARAAPGAAAGDGARRWIADNWPTVRLGLWTSVCGFAALLFSGFPGLAQLGVFSIAGLTAAALTTRWVLTATSPDGAPGMGLRRHLGRAVGACTELLPRWRWPLAALALLAALTLAWLPSPWRGDLSSLSPVGEAKMKIDADLRADLGASDAGTLVAVSAPDEAGALAAAEAAGARLDKLVESGTLAGYESPARILPSPALQQARRDALPEAATLSARLAAATVDGPLPAARLGSFIADVQAARAQALLTRASLKGTPLYAALDALLVPGDGVRPWRALLSLQAGARPIDPAQLRATLAGVPGAQVIDIGNELRGLYTRYLHEATVQALLGAAAVCLLLALHLRSVKRLWRIAQPVAAAVLIVIAAFSVAGAALGILHLVGLLLTVAIGSNYALFFDQIRAQQDAAPPGTPWVVDNDTLASLALANLTAVISFCLLAFSSIPALYAIGQIVAPGILLSLLLSAAFIPARAR
ncbi:MMPL family transporter [Rhizobacter sp. Root404]|uniref:MMPL family transporter n=1 Tax=Rhizobacter sp. Root404 TaxID=1736528 RepID=UPI0007018731|nr:MMPL family transporter [Rhizobacter sp. Root404]KQW35924.1 transporter [Rhizobacter sp. Root404]